MRSRRVRGRETISRQPCFIPNVCVVDPTVLRGDKGAGGGGGHSGDIVESDVTEAGPSNIGSSLDKSSFSVQVLELVLEDQEFRLDVKGSDTIEFATLALRWVTVSGNGRLLLLSKLLSRVIGTRNTSWTSRRAVSQYPGFRNIASFS